MYVRGGSGTVIYVCARGCFYLFLCRYPFIYFSLRACACVACFLRLPWTSHLFKLVPAALDLLINHNQACLCVVLVIVCVCVCAQRRDGLLTLKNKRRIKGITLHNFHATVLQNSSRNKWTLWSSGALFVYQQAPTQTTTNNINSLSFLFSPFPFKQRTTPQFS